MTDIQAQLADGTILSFPDGTPDEVINRTVKAQTLAAKAATLKPTIDAQAAKFPSPGPQGVDDPYPTVNNFMSNLWGSLDRNLAAPIRSPLQTLSGAAGSAVDMMRHPVDTMLAGGPGNVIARQALTPAMTQAAKGDYSGALGDVAGVGAAFAIPEAVGSMARTTAPVVAETAAAANVAPTFEGMTRRAQGNRAVGGNMIDDISKSGNSLASAARAARNVYAKVAAPIQERIATEVATPAEMTKLQLQRLKDSIAAPDKGGTASSIRNAPRLLRVAPELADLPVGPEFDNGLVQIFRDKELGINKAADAVSPTVTIEKAPILAKWRQIVQEANASPFTRGAAAALNNAIKAWNALPDKIPWQQFRELKQNFLKDSKTPTFRRAYQELMDNESAVSKDLEKANADYSVIRRALDDAKIIVARDEAGNIINAQRVRTPKRK